MAQIRMSLANLLSGGLIDEQNELLTAVLRDTVRLRKTMAAIAEEETPGANATVRRMAELARKAIS